MTDKLIKDQIQEQMNHAVECINEEQYPPAKLAFLECASLTEMLDVNKNTSEEQKQPTHKQKTFDIDP